MTNLVWQHGVPSFSEEMCVLNHLANRQSFPKKINKATASEASSKNNKLSWFPWTYSWKKCTSNSIISPRSRVEHKKSLSCHHPLIRNSGWPRLDVLGSSHVSEKHPLPGERWDLPQWSGPTSSDCHVPFLKKKRSGGVEVVPERYIIYIYIYLTNEKSRFQLEIYTCSKISWNAKNPNQKPT